MRTELLEFTNSNNDILRGIATFPNINSNLSTIFLHGFERCSTTEKKFKKFQDELTSNGQTCLRFDFTGCGLSDGDFRNTTLGSMTGDFKNAIGILLSRNLSGKINIVAHSLGAVVLANLIPEIKNKINKIVLIAPALNQKELMRYRFVTSKMRKVNPSVVINWLNYRQYLNEEEFQSDCRIEKKMSKMNYIDPAYFLECKDIDFSLKLKDCKSKVLHIHGDKDISVPKESLNTIFPIHIDVLGGDHDMEKPDQFVQWFDEALKFLSN